MCRDVKRHMDRYRQTPAILVPCLNVIVMLYVVVMVYEYEVVVV